MLRERSPGRVLDQSERCQPWSEFRHRRAFAFAFGTGTGLGFAKTGLACEGATLQVRSGTPPSE